MRPGILLIWMPGAVVIKDHADNSGEEKSHGKTGDKRPAFPSQIVGLIFEFNSGYARGHKFLN